MNMMALRSALLLGALVSVPMIACETGDDGGAVTAQLNRLRLDLLRCPGRPRL